MFGGVVVEYKFINNISIKALNEDIFKNEKLILLDFYAMWYKPSVSSINILEEIGEKYFDELKVYIINFDKFRDISKEFEVTSLPTLIFIKNGEEAYRATGTQEKEQIETIIDIIK